MNGISKTLFRNKFKFISYVLALHVILNVGMMVFQIASHSHETISYTAGIFGFTVAGFVMLSTYNEKIYSSNRYRMVPITDNQLYFSNLWTSIVGLIYLGIGEILIYGLSYLVRPNPYDKIMITDILSSGHVGYKLLILLIVGLVGILFLTAITTINFLINWLNNASPFKKQKFVTVILTFVVTWILLIPFNFITMNVLRLVGVNKVGVSYAAFQNVIWTGLIMCIIWLLLFILINLYFINNWSETTNK